MIDLGRYAFTGMDAVPSPALIFYADLIRANIAAAVRLAGSPERLRPHAKTHKTREVAALAMAHGISKHKCATLAEAAMLAEAGATDVFVAYAAVGPNIARLADLMRRFPQCTITVQADDPANVRALSDAMTASGVTLGVLIDLDVGFGRTGVPPGDLAGALYAQIAASPGLVAAGLHAYDGHVTDAARDARQAATERSLALIGHFAAELRAAGLPVPRIVMGGTPTFPQYAAADLVGLECSPGTLFLHDQGYASRYADLAAFVPACLVLTRVVSRPAGGRLTFDLGSKAVASDPPAGQRARLLGFDSAPNVVHSEEHFVVTTPDWERYPVGTATLAVPMHVCPTVALHKEAVVVEGGRVTAQWAIRGRDRGV